MCCEQCKKDFNFELVITHLSPLQLKKCLHSQAFVIKFKISKLASKYSFYEL